MVTLFRHELFRFTYLQVADIRKRSISYLDGKRTRNLAAGRFTLRKE